MGQSVAGPRGLQLSSFSVNWGEMLPDRMAAARSGGDAGNT